MDSLAIKIGRIARAEGVSAVLTRAAFSLYRRSVRRLLPSDGWVSYGGLAVGRERKRLDLSLFRRVLPPDLRNNATYEQGLIAALRAVVREGDTVVVIGGGEGITTALAATIVGDTGRVICFEGDKDGIAATMRTASANGVADRVECRYAVVAANLGVFGTAVSSVIVRPQDLPDCDVLEMDCEGSEVQILREMTIRPRAVAVETHGFADAPSSTTRALLESRGYRVQDLGLAEPKEACIGRDERVLLARRP